MSVQNIIVVRRNCFVHGNKKSPVAGFQAQCVVACTRLHNNLTNVQNYRRRTSKMHGYGNINVVLEQLYKTILSSLFQFRCV